MEIPPSVSKPKILIVDDCPANLQVLLQNLKQDYAVIAATTGEKALILAATAPLPDLILLDVLMPGLNGYDVCQRLKQDPLTQDIPIIFVSTREDAADETKGFALGAVDYITKPFSPPVVKARLKSHLTLQRLNQALLATNQDLTAATRHKDEFLANMSHELRTPLTTILGFTEALQDGIFGQLAQKQWDALSSIDKSSQYLLSLINDILDLSKIVAGKVELQQSPTAIAELCRASLLFVQHQAHRKNIQIDYFIPDKLDLVLMDERKIKQALINLLNNAVKFTPNNGTVSLTVIVKNRPGQDQVASQPQLVFQVKDTGVGIGVADQKQLFQPFVQIKNHLNSQETGTGLGLALVKKIAELHQGDAWVESELGQGSCFSLALPLRFQATRFSSSSSAVANIVPFPSNGLAPLPQSPLVLLIEDNLENRHTHLNYLNARRYRVIAVENSQQAIALAHAQKPDIILMDIQKSEFNGYEVARSIRANPTISHIPIVAMTASSTSQDPARCLAEGLNHYLPKPFRLKELTHAIDRLLA